MNALFLDNEEGPRLTRQIGRDGLIYRVDRRVHLNAEER